MIFVDEIEGIVESREVPLPLPKRYYIPVAKELAFGMTEEESKKPVEFENKVYELRGITWGHLYWRIK